VPLGVVARGSHSAGAIEVAAAARSWERLGAPVRVSWFPARPYPQLLAEPTPGTILAPERQLTLTFSSPIRDVLGALRPRLSPAMPGRWRLLDAHTLAFQPRGPGFGLGTDVRVELPRAAHLAGRAGTTLTRTLRWRIPDGSTLRLQQLLAQLGYLPLDWQPTADPAPASTGAQLAAALSPPPGRFAWRYPNTPAELRTLWRPRAANEITRGAVMMFEHTHGLAVDGLAGPNVWRALIGEAVAGKRRTSGYSYVYVHRNLPQSLNLWHDGRVILSSPGNTGVPAAPTQLGTFPVFEHIPVGTMSGTNPDRSRYHDPGIRYISYFHGGDAIHAFNRASFGTPQSLGCVELPLDAAAKVWPHTPIGTLVTIEN
jgi:peptidoglycan hydrolase-like protein with peptidoglycan-binding domain